MPNSSVLCSKNCWEGRSHIQCSYNNSTTLWKKNVKSAGHGHWKVSLWCEFGPLILERLLLLSPEAWGICFPCWVLASIAFWYSSTWLHPVGWRLDPPPVPWLPVRWSKHASACMEDWRSKSGGIDTWDTCVRAQSHSRVRLFAIKYTIAHQVPLSIPEQGAIFFSRASSPPKDWTNISWSFCTGRLILYPWATWKDHWHIR